MSGPFPALARSVWSDFRRARGLLVVFEVFFKLSACLDGQRGSQMDRLIKRGVDNIITDDPDRLIRVRDDWARLTRAERLLRAALLLLGLDRRE